MTRDSSWQCRIPRLRPGTPTMDAAAEDFPTAHPVLGFAARRANPEILGSAHAALEGVQR